MTNPIRLTTSLEIKSLSNMQFEGHGSVFGNVDLGGDVVMPGAFKRTLAEQKADDKLPVMLWMHDPSRVAGKWLDMHEDDRGLVTKGQLAPTDLGKEVHTLLKMEAVSGLSIGYIPTEVDYNSDGIRVIKDVDLLEVSVVSIPMNPRAQIQHVKARLSARGEYVPREDELAELKRDAEKFLRARGFTKSMARVCAGSMFKELFDLGETPKSNAKPGERPAENASGETPEQSPIKTPDEIEAHAGLQSFREKQEAYELRKTIDKYFRQ